MLAESAPCSYAFRTRAASASPPATGSTSRSGAEADGPPSPSRPAACACRARRARGSGIAVREPVLPDAIALRVRVIGRGGEARLRAGRKAVRHRERRRLALGLHGVRPALSSRACREMVAASPAATARWPGRGSGHAHAGGRGGFFGLLGFGFFVGIVVGLLVVDLVVLIAPLVGIAAHIIGARVLVRPLTTPFRSCLHVRISCMLPPSLPDNVQGVGEMWTRARSSKRYRDDTERVTRTRPPEPPDSLTPLSELTQPIDPDAADRRRYVATDEAELPASPHHRPGGCSTPH